MKNYLLIAAFVTLSVIALGTINSSVYTPVLVSAKQMYAAWIAFATGISGAALMSMKVVPRM